MLTTLTIKNFVIIRELSLDLSKGMTVITGETGSGKSIIIKAIEIALGKRIEKQSILDQTKSCEISLTFDISKNKSIIFWLKDLELEQEDGEIIIRRVLTSEGRSKNYINNTPINLSTLKDFTKQVMNIHGQHENQLILNQEHQLNIIDNYGNYSSALRKVEHSYQKWKQIKAEILELSNVTSSKERIELLQFQIEEIKGINNILIDIKNFENRHCLLTNSQDIQSSCDRAIKFLNNDDDGVLKRVQDILNELNNINKINSTELTDTITCLKDSMVQLSEANSSLNSFYSNIEYNPEELLEIDSQLQKVYAIAKKYCTHPHDLQKYLLKIESELKNLKNKDQKLIELNNKLEIIEKEYQEQAYKLYKLREKTASDISKKITQQIILLDMCGPFEINLQHDPNNTPNMKGLDHIYFSIKTNPNSPSSRIEKIASGGELSRISLAIQAVIGKHTSIPTMIFDEVDVGISGSTAEIVGKLLKNISSNAQIICITHLAQVASLAHQHLKVSKITTRKNTETRVIKLGQEDRINEIARILGGIKITNKTLQYAKEMVSP